MTMKLYADPISTTSRGVMLYLAEHPMDVEQATVSLMAGEHQKPEFAAINPNKAVPVLVDGDFVLSEASAILKYLADLNGGAGYPSDLRQRARVNQAMDWLNTGFYKDFGYGVVYCRTLPNQKYEAPQTEADIVARACDRAAAWLNIMDSYWLGGQPFLCGQAPTIADYLGAAYISIGDWVGFDLSPYPNVERWLKSMRSRPSWTQVNGAWDGVTAYMRSQVLQPA
jgi:glutathione S-transferase